MIELDGYVIVYNPKDKYANWQGSTSTFGLSPIESWIRQIGSSKYYNLSLGDRSLLIQKYHDVGFRLKKAKIMIDNNDEK